MQTYVWVKKNCEFIFEYCMSLINLNYIEQQEMKTNPVKFSELNKILSKNIRIEPLLIKTGNHLLLKHFQQAILRTTKMHL